MFEATKGLINPLLDTLVASHSESVIDDKDFENSVYYYAYEVICDLFRANPELTFRCVVNFVMNQKDIPISGEISALYGISALCYPISNNELNDFITQSISSYILIKCSNANPRISQIAFYTLKRISSSHPIIISNPNILPQIFATIAENMSRNIIVTIEIIDLLITIIESFTNEINEGNYDNYIKLFEMMNNSELIQQSEIVDKPYDILTHLINKNGIHITEVKLKQLLELNLQQLYEILQNPFTISYVTLKEIGIMKLLGDIILKLKKGIHYILPRLYELFVNIIRNQKFELIENALQNLSRMFYSDQDFFDFREEIFDAFKMTIHCGNPLIMGLSAIAIGDFFFQINAPINFDILNQPLEQLYNLLEDPNVDNKRDYYANVVRSIGLILRKHYNVIPEELKIRYLNKLMELTKIYTMDNRTDEVKNLFSAIAVGFTSLFMANDIIKRDDNEFIRCFIVFIKKIWYSEAYDEENISEIYKMVDALIDATNSKYNIQLQSKELRYLMSHGLTLSDPIVEQSEKLLKKFKGCDINKIY